MLQVQLRPGLQDGRWAYLRPLCGHDEGWVNGAGLVEATRFLDRLLVEMPGTTVGPGKANDLAVCDCDRLFAALYLHYFGDRIESTVPCSQCQTAFELSFSLSEVLAKLEDQPPTAVTGPDETGLYTLQDGRRFRLPTVGHRQSVMGLEPEEAVRALLERCVVEGDPNQSPDELQAAMDEVGAVLDLTLAATCPDCGVKKNVQFDIQTYLLHSLAFEKRFLHQEIHHIAMAYGWGYEEILSLMREDRRKFVRLIAASPASPRRQRA